MTAAVSVVTAILLSPLLAAWTIALTTDPDTALGPWWRPRSVSAARLATVAAVAAVLAAGAAGGDPILAWWVFATGGTVLCVTDAQHHLLPARLVYPLGATVLTVLAMTAAATGEPDRVLRALLAAAVVGAGWFTVAFLAPSALGLGDVRVAALASGLAGWTSWSAVLAGQLAAFALAVVTAGIVAITDQRAGFRAVQVPIGPALIVGAILVTWR